MSCACNKRIQEKNAKLATMNYKSCTIAAAAVAAREQRRLCTPKYTLASGDVGTNCTQVGWNHGPSSCIRSWHCNVGERVKMKETFYGDSDIVVKAAVGDKIELDRVERHENEAGPSGRWTSVAALIQAKGGLGRRNDDEAGPSGNNDDEAGPSGINASEAASVEVTGTGLVNGRPVINRLYIEQLFNSSDDSDDDFWDPDEGFHERCIDGKNIKILSMNVLLDFVARDIVTLFLGAFCFCAVILT